MDVLDLKSLDWTSLKHLYDKNLALLQEKLLSGADWNEAAYLRNLVTQLETALDNSVPPQPARNKARSTEYTQED